MAPMNGAFQVRVEWLDSPGVATPELAATWGRYEIWVAGRCATYAESADGTARRSVFGSLYPLAEWVSSNWWLLRSHVRPTAVDSKKWDWANVSSFPWLSQHNLRGAGDGMTWPNMTLVSEGAVTSVVWAPDTAESLGPLRFISSGRATITTDEFLEGLDRFVSEVLTRLSEQGLTKTLVHEEWRALASADEEEREFCSAVARLGQDPYALDEDTAANVVAVANTLPEPILADFFDSADVSSLVRAAAWTNDALKAVTRASRSAQSPVAPLYSATSGAHPRTGGRPWLLGYEMARAVRQAQRQEELEAFDTARWVGSVSLGTPSAGIRGVAGVRGERCGVVLAERHSTKPAVRFGQARALGRILMRPDASSFVLSSAGGFEEQVARAFAAELLAPAQGIGRMLDRLGGYSYDRMGAVAKHYGVSPILVNHQFENQLAGAPGAVT